MSFGFTLVVSTSSTDPTSAQGSQCTTDEIKQGRHACHEQVPDDLTGAAAPSPADTMMVDKEQRYHPHRRSGGFGGGGPAYGVNGSYNKRPYYSRRRRDVIVDI